MIWNTANLNNSALAKEEFYHAASRKLEAQQGGNSEVSEGYWLDNVHMEQKNN